MSNWISTMLNRLNFKNWKLLKRIISNCDRKFFTELWSILFDKFEVKLLYSTTYYFQTDDLSERTIQFIKIALRWFLSTLKNVNDWSTIVNSMQRDFNNSLTSTKKTSNKLCYDFTFCISTDLIASINCSESSFK